MIYFVLTVIVIVLFDIDLNVERIRKIMEKRGEE